MIVFVYWIKCHLNIKYYGIFRYKHWINNSKKVYTEIPYRHNTGNKFIFNNLLSFKRHLNNICNFISLKSVFTDSVYKSTNYIRFYERLGIEKHFKSFINKASEIAWIVAKNGVYVIIRNWTYIRTGLCSQS